MTIVVNIKTEKYDVYIGRHQDPIMGKWGNPFSCKEGTLAKYKTSTRKESIEKHLEYVRNTPELINSLHELKDKKLGCFCVPKSCHGNNYVLLLNELKTQSLF